MNETVTRFETNVKRQYFASAFTLQILDTDSGYSCVFANFPDSKAF